jgi:hypothetical protein
LLLLYPPLLLFAGLELLLYADAFERLPYDAALLVAFVFIPELPLYDAVGLDILLTLLLAIE